jgi:ethanolaminephosphotransferase
MFRLEPNWIAISLLSSAFLTFFVATWEEYHTGCLYLGYISGPVEGTLIVIGLCLVGAYYGGSIWLERLNLPGNISVTSNAAFGYSTVFFAVITIGGR